MAPRAASAAALLFLAAATGSCGREAEALPTILWTVRDEPALVIGAQPSRAGHDLLRIAGAARLDDGRIAIAEAATAELRLFGSDGELLHTVPRDVGGFIELLGRMPGDTLLILATDGIVVQIDPDGTTHESQPFPLAYGAGCNAPSTCSLQFMPDGTLLLRHDQPGPDGTCRSRDAVRRTPALVTRIDWRTGRVDTLGSFAGTEWNGRNRRAYGAELAITSSLQHIFVGETAGDSIVVIDTRGARVGRWGLPLRALTIPRAAQRRPKAPFSMLRDRAGTAPDAWSYPARYPRFARLLADRSGFVWVMRYPEARDPLRATRFQCSITPHVPAEGADWIVIAPDGHMASEVHTPPGLFPFEVGDDYVLGIASDSTAVATVRLHALDRGHDSPPFEQQI